jgi:tetraacyldisaccharide-1-P 4'-kinase
LLDLLYGEIARWRRRSFERHPDRRRRLARPVISVGNLSVGGTGKSPVVAALAAWLVQHGERPAILSRGYGRRDDVPGVVVVSDGHTLRAGLGRSGDEPLMLARAVPGAIVCVCPDRHLAGVLAERRLGATVHLLDDGFQHFTLARDLDVLVTAPGEIGGGRVLPRGRLREPQDAAARAHVLVVMGATAGAAASEGWALGVGLACGAERVLGEPCLVGPASQPSEPQAPSLKSQAPILETQDPSLKTQDPGFKALGPRLKTQDPRLKTQDPRPVLSPGSRVLVACGIANPRRFVEDLAYAGYVVAGEVLFGDHHTFSAADIARISAAVLETGAEAVLTTDKDAVRFEDAGARPFVLYRVPLGLRFEPPDVLFESVSALIAADGRRQTAASDPPDGNRQPADTDPATGNRQRADGEGLS